MVCTNDELKAAMKLVIEQEGLARTLHALACAASEKAADAGIWSLAWHDSASLISRASNAPAVVRVSTGLASGTVSPGL
jgi:hypothetical protein